MLVFSCHASTEGMQLCKANWKGQLQRDSYLQVSCLLLDDVDKAEQCVYRAGAVRSNKAA